MEEFYAVGSGAHVEKIYADDTGRLYIYDDRKRAELDAISLKARLGVAVVFKVEIERGE